MSTYNIIAASNESTVVAEYTPESARSDSFQSEAALERSLSACSVNRDMSIFLFTMKAA